VSWFLFCRLAVIGYVLHVWCLFRVVVVLFDFLTLVASQKNGQSIGRRIAGVAQNNHLPPPQCLQARLALSSRKPRPVLIHIHLALLR
jgi:hypothetical protein